MKNKLRFLFTKKSKESLDGREHYCIEQERD